jgi:trimeric autotransporter adhesin
MFKKFGAVLALTGFLFSSSVFAQATRAGERIENTATATYTDSSGVPQVTTSLAAVTVVSQVFRLTITPDSAPGAADDAATNFAAGVPALSNQENSLPNGSVNFGYIVTNPGNGDDTYTLNVELPAGSPLTNISVYLDTNGNGIADSGEPLITGYNSTTRTGTVAVPRNSSQNVVVVATASGTVSATAHKLDLVGYRGASFAASATLERDRNNLSQVTSVSDAILSLSVTPSGPNLSNGQINYAIAGSNSGNQCARSVPGAVVIATGNASLPAGTYNGIVIENVISVPPLPSGSSYVAGSAIGASGGALTRVIYSTATTGTGWTPVEPTANLVRRVGLLILPASPVGAAQNTAATPENTICTSVDYSLNFSVTVPTSTPAGTIIPDTATITSRSANTANTTPVVQTANASSTMPSILGVVIAPNTQASVANGTTLTGSLAGAAASCTDPVTTRRTPSGTVAFDIAGTTGDTTAANADRTVVPNAFPMNATACFVNTIRNSGNTNENYDVSFDAALSNLPANTQVTLFQADGTNPLPTNLNIAAGASVNVVVKVTFDGATAPTAPVNGFNAVVRATAQSNSSITDITVNRFSSLSSGVSVSIFNNDTNTGTSPTTGTLPSAATGTSSTPVGITANAGTSVTYPLVVQNTGSSPDNFTLTANGAGIPSGATVTFYEDTNGNGVLDAGEPVRTSTGVIPATTPTTNGVRQLLAVVTIPANAAPQTSAPISFVATSTSNTGVTAAITNTLTINANNALTFTSDSTRTLSPGGTVIHTHIVANNGNSSVTALQIAPATGRTDFIYAIYLDNPSTTGGSIPGTIDPTDELISSTTPTTIGTPIAPGGQRTVLVQVSTPSNIASGEEDIRSITATGTFSAGGTASGSVQDTTRVVAGNIQVNKTATATASPRSLLTSANFSQSEITYTITVANVGSAPVTNVIVLDAIPQFTDFKFGSVATNCATALPGATCAIEYSTDNGATWSATAPADTNTNGYSDAADAARVTNIRVVVTNPTSTPINAFPNGTSIAITFVVSVR